MNNPIVQQVHHTLRKFLGVSGREARILVPLFCVAVCAVIVLAILVATTF